MLPSKEEARNILPIQHISYSSMRCYFLDMNKFYKQYVRGEWESFSTSYSLLLGSAIHFGIELFWWNIKRSLDDPHNGDDLRNQARKSREAWSDFVLSTVGSGEISKIIEQSKEALLREAEEKESIGKLSLGKTQTIEGALSDLEETLLSYINECPIYKPRYIESADVFDFSGPEQKEMPVPLKTKIDMIAYDQNNDLVVVDHKTTTRGYETKVDEISPAFDWQAGIYYLGCFMLCGKPPKKMIYDQVFKGKLKVWSGYGPKLGELKEMCSEAGLSFADNANKDTLKHILLKNGVVETPGRISSYVIDYKEDLRPLQSFFKAYETMVTDLYIRSKHDLPFLVNPFKVFNDKELDETYKDWLGI